MAETATVVVERRIAASPERVFDAWLDPDSAGQWLFATPDGDDGAGRDRRRASAAASRSSSGAATDLAEHHGEYVEIDRPRRLAFDFWTSFSDERTRVTVDHRARRRRRRC